MTLNELLAPLLRLQAKYGDTTVIIINDEAGDFWHLQDEVLVGDINDEMYIHLYTGPQM